MASGRGKRSAAARGSKAAAAAAPSSPAKRAKPASTKVACEECTHEFWDDYWENEYDEEASHWGSEPTSFLVKYIKKLEGEKKKEEIRVLVPMCGMSSDLKWLAEQGYPVVGLELAKKAVQRFFDKFDIKYSVEKKKDFSVFKADDLPLKIYQGDMFKFTSALEPAFTAVWDSHAMHAVNMKDQKRYADTMKAVMAPDCHYLIDSMQYDLDDLPEGFHDHPHPHLVTAEDTLELFGDKFQLEELDSEDKSMDWFHMSGKDKEAKGHGHGDKGKGKGKAKQGKAKGHGDDRPQFKFKSMLFLMTRKPSKK